ncbi:MAG: N-acetylmuramoyl-L-alanine amidase [Candidatus Manganitrophaceae bacterium]
MDTRFLRPKPSHQKQNSLFVRWRLLFCAFFLLPSLFLAASIEAAGDPLKEATLCKERLRESPERKKIRAQWEQCLGKYRKSPSYKKREKGALLDVARLYQELYLYSHRPEDLKTARDHYQKVAENGPDSPSAKEARRQINRIDALFPPMPKTEKSKEGSKGITDGPENGNGGIKGDDAQAATGGEEKSILSNIRHWVYPDYTRIVIDLSRPATYEVVNPSPTSLLISLSKTILGELFQKQRLIAVREGPLRRIEVRQKERDLIDVLLTFKKIGSHKTIPLSDPDRLVIDVSNTKEDRSQKETSAKKPDSGPDLAALPPAPPFAIETIVIDAGHGGKDPGAIGVNGLEEKEVVLDVSLRLRSLIEKKLKKKVILTRDQDLFLSLEERARLANGKADLFVSVHANSSPKRQTHGVEIYFLGRASDENAIEVAARENATSREAALNFQEAILNDLQRDFNTNESLEFAHFTEGAFVEELVSHYPTLSLGVKRAPFYVLVNTKMPAILAEISFLTHADEEKRLRNDQYRQKIAESLFKGIERYLDSVKIDS